jgi:hypothetical protein
MPTEGNTMTTKLLRAVPPRLKGKIAKAAERRGTSVNGLIVETLAADFGVEYVAPTRSGNGRDRTAYPNIVLNLPTALANEIEARAEANDETQRNVMMRILCAAFNEKFVPTGRWPQRSAA